MEYIQKYHSWSSTNLKQLHFFHKHIKFSNICFFLSSCYLSQLCKTLIWKKKRRNYRISRGDQDQGKQHY